MRVRRSILRFAAVLLAMAAVVVLLANQPRMWPGVFAGFGFGAALGSGLVAHLLARKPAEAYLWAHADRLACAQHWARGALLSKPTEAWRPICSAIALAALGSEDDRELLTLLRDKVGELDAGDPELANIWRQALAEFLAQQKIRNLELLTGVSPTGVASWNHATLRTAAAQLLDLANRGAEQMLIVRRNPSEQPPRFS